MSSRQRRYSSRPSGRAARRTFQHPSHRFRQGDVQNRDWDRFDPGAEKVDRHLLAGRAHLLAEALQQRLERIARLFDLRPIESRQGRVVTHVGLDSRTSPRRCSGRAGVSEVQGLAVRLFYGRALSGICETFIAFGWRAYEGCGDSIPPPAVPR